jgi:hypothetical protein
VSTGELARRLPLTIIAAAPLPVLGRCASCAPGRLALDYVAVPAAGGSGRWLACAESVQVTNPRAVPLACH